jgi:hypothetical protein
MNDRIPDELVPSQKKKTASKPGFSRVLIGILALLVGVIAGAGGFYLIGITPRDNIEAQLEAKTAQIEVLETKLDSLTSLFEEVSKLPDEQAAMIDVLLDTVVVDDLISLGKEVGGKWQVQSVEDIYFLDDNLLFIRIDDGHIPAMALVRLDNVGKPDNFRNWTMLWADYF